MQVCRHFLIINVLVALLVVSTNSKASKIPLRVDSAHGIFMQEIWQDQKPLICVANTSDKNQIIQVFSRQSSLESTQPLVHWQAEAGTVNCHLADKLQVSSLLEYRFVGGIQFGLLRTPALPVDFVDVDSELDSFIAIQGLNGSCTTPGTWMGSSHLGFKSGQLSKVHLLTKDQSADLVLEFPVLAKINLPELKITAVSSTSLHVQKTNQGFSIGAAQDKNQAKIHQVTMEFIAPQVSRPTLFLLSGRKRAANNGWGCFARGIVIEP